MIEEISRVIIGMINDKCSMKKVHKYLERKKKNTPKYCKWSVKSVIVIEIVIGSDKTENHKKAKFGTGNGRCGRSLENFKNWVSHHPWTHFRPIYSQKVGVAFSKIQDKTTPTSGVSTVIRCFLKSKYTQKSRHFTDFDSSLIKKETDIFGHHEIFWILICLRVQK